MHHKSSALSSAVRLYSPAFPSPTTVLTDYHSALTALTLADLVSSGLRRKFLTLFLGQ